MMGCFFDCLAIEPKLGFGNIQFIIPDDTVASDIDMSGSEKCFIA